MPCGENHSIQWRCCCRFPYDKLLINVSRKLSAVSGGREFAFVFKFSLDDGSRKSKVQSPKLSTCSKSERIASPWTLDFGLWTLDFGLWTRAFNAEEFPTSQLIRLKVDFSIQILRLTRINRLTVLGC